MKKTKAFVPICSRHNESCFEEGFTFWPLVDPFQLLLQNNAAYIPQVPSPVMMDRVQPDPLLRDDSGFLPLAGNIPYEQCSTNEIEKKAVRLRTTYATPEGSIM